MATSKRSPVDSEDRAVKKTKAEQDLEQLVFGGDIEIDENQSEATSSDSGSEEEAEAEETGDSLFFVDTARGAREDKDEEDESESTASEEEEVSQPAWVDDDTEQTTVALTNQSRTKKLRQTMVEDEVLGDVYEERLRQQFQKIHAVPKWAAKAESSEEDSDGEELMKTTKSLMAKTTHLLAPSKLDVVGLRAANQQAPSQSAVLNVQFHPASSVILTAGLDKTLRLFEVDGKENQKIQSIYFKDLPITTAQFIRGGQEIVVSGKRNYYYSVDVEQGSVSRINGIQGHKMKSLEYMHGSCQGDRLAVMSNGGEIHLLSARTKQFIHTLPMNGVVRDVSFTGDGNYLWSIGLDNEVYQWDLRQNKCISRWHDASAFRPTCLGLSQDGSYFASGDNTGVVNIYDTGSVDRSSGAFNTMKPFKSVDNLTTSIRGVKFNYHSEILGIYSRHKTNQLKLLHLPTATVFANWPSGGSSGNLGTVQCMDFSPASGFMAVGSDTGKALLYRLSHYPNY